MEINVSFLLSSLQFSVSGHQMCLGGSLTRLEYSIPGVLLLRLLSGGPDYSVLVCLYLIPINPAALYRFSPLLRSRGAPRLSAMNPTHTQSQWVHMLRMYENL